MELFTMAVTSIIANLTAPDPKRLALFYQQVFQLDLPHDMGWIAFLNNEATQKIELHTASQGGGGTEMVLNAGRELDRGRELGVTPRPAASIVHCSELYFAYGAAPFTRRLGTGRNLSVPRSRNCGVTLLHGWVAASPQP
jgi:hypothetical protein